MGNRNKLLTIAAIIAALVDVSAAHSPPNENHNTHYGSGAITRCEYPGTSGYFISKDKYPYSGAAAACTALGGSLADINADNFLHASDIVLSCTGPNQRAWIGYVFKICLQEKSRKLILFFFLL